MTLDICIVTWNRLDVYTCLDSLLKHLDVESNIYVVDNGSLPASLHLLESVPQKYREYGINIKMKFLDNNYGPAKGWNEAIKMGDGDYIAIFNDDYECVEPWANTLLTLYEELPNVGIITPTFGPEPKKSSIKAIEYAPWGYRLFLFSRKLFNEVGPFDERYMLGYEDTDFVQATYKKGKKLMCVEGINIVHHLKHSEAHTLINTVNFEKNHNIFMSKFPEGVIK